jgi:hypothetical protein
VYEASCKKKGKPIVKYEQKSPVKSSRVAAPVLKKEAKKRKLVSDDLDDTGWKLHVHYFYYFSLVLILIIYNRV